MEIEHRPNIYETTIMGQRYKVYECSCGVNFKEELKDVTVNVPVGEILR